jgi:hypothetical protein
MVVWLGGKNEVRENCVCLSFRNGSLPFLVPGLVRDGWWRGIRPSGQERRKERTRVLKADRIKKMFDEQNVSVEIKSG